MKKTSAARAGIAKLAAMGWSAQIDRNRVTGVIRLVVRSEALDTTAMHRGATLDAVVAAAIAAES